jgi:recombination protein RecA
MSDQNAKQKTAALELAIASVEKDFGKGAIMRLKDGDNLIHDEVQAVPSGLHRSTSRWASAVIRGVASSRSTARSPAARRPSPCTPSRTPSARAAPPRSSTPNTRSTSHYAKKLGVKTDELLLSQPDYGEQALEIADMLVRSNAVDIVVIDSVAALVPKAEIEGDMGDSHVGLQARLMSQALRKLTGTVSRSQCLLVFINQIRHEDRRDVRQPGDHQRRQRPQVLRQPSASTSAAIGAIKEAGASGGKEDRSSATGPA